MLNVTRQKPHFAFKRGAASALFSVTLLTSLNVAATAGSLESQQHARHLARFNFTGTFRFKVDPAPSPVRRSQTFVVSKPSTIVRNRTTDVAPRHALTATHPLARKKETNANTIAAPVKSAARFTTRRYTVLNKRTSAQATQQRLITAAPAAENNHQAATEIKRPPTNAISRDARSGLGVSPATTIASDPQARTSSPFDPESSSVTSDGNLASAPPLPSALWRLSQPTRTSTARSTFRPATRTRTRVANRKKAAARPTPVEEPAWYAAEPPWMKRALSNIAD